MVCEGLNPRQSKSGSLGGLGESFHLCVLTSHTRSVTSIGTLLLCFVAVLLGIPHIAEGQFQSLASVRRTNRRIRGTVLEFTRQHGSDNRLHSAILDQRRDIYVYLPPGYDCRRRYPLMLWMHGAFGDEHAFLTTGQFEWLDKLICQGCCPPVVVVGPDISCKGKNFILAKHSFALNGCCGRFQDHIMCEVLPWARRSFSVSCHRCETGVIGVSAGGLGAMNLALKHRGQFGIVATLAGALNLRYNNRECGYLADFNPATFCMQTVWQPDLIAGQLGPLKVKAKMFLEPVFGQGPDVAGRITNENPADLVVSTDLKPCELKMLVSYGRQDGLNFDAHAESFIWLCQQRGVHVDVDRDSKGGHSSKYFKPAQRRAWCWLGRQLQHAELPTMQFASVQKLESKQSKLRRE